MSASISGLLSKAASVHSAKRESIKFSLEMHLEIILKRAWKRNTLKVVKRMNMKLAKAVILMEIFLMQTHVVLVHVRLAVLSNDAHVISNKINQIKETKDKKVNFSRENKNRVMLHRLEAKWIRSLSLKTRNWSLFVKTRNWSQFLTLLHNNFFHTLTDLGHMHKKSVMILKKSKV